MTFESSLKCDGCAKTTKEQTPEGWVQVHLLALAEPQGEPGPDALNEVNATHYHSVACAANALDKAQKKASKGKGASRARKQTSTRRSQAKRSEATRA